MSLCSRHQLPLVSICMECKSANCEKCVSQMHQNHKCIQTHQFANNIFSDLIVPTEQFVLEKMQKAVDYLMDVFYLIRKGVVQQFGLGVPIEVLIQKSQRELPDLILRIENLKTWATNYLEEIQTALNFPFQSFIDNGNEPEVEIEEKNQLIEQIKQIDSINQKDQIKQIDPIISKDLISKIEVSKGVQQIDNIIDQGDQQQKKTPSHQPDLTEYHFILSELQKHKEKFRDEEFPPTDASLGVAEGYIWKRVSQINYGQIKFFPKKTGNVFGITDTVKQSDIIAGTQGDEVIYGLAYLFANHCADMLKECFVTQQICSEGIYALKLYFLNGTENIIYVDDFFPFEPMVNMHVTLMGTDYSIWIMLLEKAIAKMIGSYYATFQQNFQLLIKYLIPTLPIMLNSSHENIFEKIEHQLRERALIIVLPLSNVDNQGLSPLNFYQILDVVTFNQGVQLIKLRNPWGANQWMGNWGHSSQEWTQELRSQLNFQDEGTFYMDLFSFVQQFATLFCYRVYDTRQDSIMVSSRKNQAVYCKLIVGDDQDCTISIFTERLENNRKQVQKIVILKEEGGNTYTIQKFDMTYLGQNSVFFKAQKGTYIVYLKLFWEKDDSQDARVCLFGKKPMTLIQIQKIPNLIQLGFTKAAEDQGMIQKFDAGTWKILNWIRKGWYVILIKNTISKSQSYKLQFQKFNLAKLCKPFNEMMYDNQVEFTLHPNDSQTFIVKCDQRAQVLPILYKQRSQYY